MTDEKRNYEALFRHAILGDLLSRNLRRGELRPALKHLARQTYQDHHGRTRQVAYKTFGGVVLQVAPGRLCRAPAAAAQGSPPQPSS
jgi:hypothetical protein